MLRKTQTHGNHLRIRMTTLTPQLQPATGLLELKASTADSRDVTILTFAYLSRELPSTHKSRVTSTHKKL